MGFLTGVFPADVSALSCNPDRQVLTGLSFCGNQVSTGIPSQFTNSRSDISFKNTGFPQMIFSFYGFPHGSGRR